MVRAYIGLGANLGDPVRQLRTGAAALAQLSGTRMAVCSSLYRSAPVGMTTQPDFVNAVCAVDTELAALELLRALLEIECRHGRDRGVEKGGPRPLDLDLLLYGSQSLAIDELTLPHPRMHERAFVMVPLAEIAPEIEIPDRGTVAQLLRRCTGQRVVRSESW